MGIMEYFRRVFKRKKENIGSESAKFYLDEGSSKEQNNIINEAMNNKQKHSTHVKNRELGAQSKVGGRLIATRSREEMIEIAKRIKIARGEEVGPNYPSNSTELAEAVRLSMDENAVKNATDNKIGGRLVAVVPKSEVIKMVRQKKIANGEKIRPDYPANGEELAEVIAYSLRYMDEIKEKSKDDVM